MQVCSNMDIEDIVHGVTSGLQNCAVAIYNVDNHSIADKIKALCIACGAVSSHVFMVTSVLQNKSKLHSSKLYQSPLTKESIFL